MYVTYDRNNRVSFCLYPFNAGCWECDPHTRPSFKDILKQLEVVAQSSFIQTPQESFHTMQNGWKKEIADVLKELRIKEKVRVPFKSCCCLIGIDSYYMELKCYPLCLTFNFFLSSFFVMFLMLPK